MRESPVLWRLGDPDQPPPPHTPIPNMDIQTGLVSLRVAELRMQPCVVVPLAGTNGVLGVRLAASRLVASVRHYRFPIHLFSLVGWPTG